MAIRKRVSDCRNIMNETILNRFPLPKINRKHVTPEEMHTVNTRTIKKLHVKRKGQPF